MEKPQLIVTGTSEAMARFMQKVRSKGAGATRSNFNGKSVVEVRGVFGRMLEDAISIAKAEDLEIVPDKEGPKNVGRVETNQAAA